MRRAIIPAFLLLLGSAVLGATVFQQPLATAATIIPSIFVSNDASHPVPVKETNTDTKGNIKVHEQGTAAVRSADEQVAVSRTAVAELSTTCRGDLYTVPAGKQLVVEYVSAWVPDVNGRPTAAAGHFESDDLGVVLPVAFERQAFGEFVASQPVHYVFAPGRIQFTVELEGATRCSVRFSLGGYLQPAS